MELDGLHYVYSHSCDGVVFYIGCGSSTRPYDKKSRSDLWKEKVSSISDFDIDILFTSDDRGQARNEEKVLIYHIKPECNVNHVGKDPKFIKYALSNSVKLEILANKQLSELSSTRRSNRVLAWRKKDIVAEVIKKLHRKEVK